MSNALKLIEALSEMSSNDPKTATEVFIGDKEALIADLKAREAAYNAPEKFATGDIVYQRDGLSMFKLKKGEPVIVIDVFDEPHFLSDANAGSPSYRQPMTMKIGTIDSDGDLLIYCVDGARFTKDPS